VQSIAFYLPFENLLKVFGPLFDYLLAERRGEFRIVVLLPRWLARDERPTAMADTVRQTWGAAVEVRELETARELVELIGSGAFDIFANARPMVPGVPPHEVDAMRRTSAGRGTLWVALPEGVGQDVQIAEAPARMLDQWDVLCVTGTRSAEYIDAVVRRTSPRDANALMQRVAITGYPQFDPLASYDADAIRRKYDLGDKPVVVVATAPIFYPRQSSAVTLRGLVRRFRGEMEWSPRGLAARAASLRYPYVVPYRRYLEALRAFADRNGALLVGKTRRKHLDPPYVGDSLDRLIDDRSFHPFTTQELMSVSSLYFGFYSATSIEALAAGVYGITAVFLPPEQVEPQPQWRAWGEAFFFGQQGSWRIPGVTDIVDGMSLSGSRALERLSGAQFSDYALDRSRCQAEARRMFSHLGRGSAGIADVLAGGETIRAGGAAGGTRIAVPGTR